MYKSFRRLTSLLKRCELFPPEQNVSLQNGQRAFLCSTTLNQENDVRRQSHAQTFHQHMKDVGNEGEIENNEQPVKAIGLTQDEQWRQALLHPDQPPDARVLSVAIIGAPNAGKSTLTNKLMGWRVSAVSAKVHTTRNKTKAVLTEGNTQLILLDTPGVVKKSEGKRYNLDRQCVVDPASSIGEADIVGVLVDASNKWTNTHLNKEILRALYMYPDKRTVLIINKVDILKSKHMLLEIVRLLTEGVVDGHRDSTTILTPSELKHKSKEDPYKFIKDLKHELESLESGNKQKNNNDLKNKESEDSSRTDVNIMGYTCKNERIELHGPIDEVTQNERIELHGPIDEVTQNERIELHGPIDEVTQNEVNTRNDMDFRGNLQNDNKTNQSIKTASHKQTFKPLPKSKKYDPTRPFLEQSQSAKGFKEERKLIRNAVISKEMNSNWITEHNKQSEINNLIKNKRGWGTFEKVFIVSSTTGEGVDELRDFMFNVATPGNWHYHSSMVTDQNPAEIAKMCVWEKCMDHLPEEIPYSIDVEIVMWEMEEGLLRAIMNINCYKQRHVSFVVGKAGRMIQKLAMEAKQELMNSFKCDMTLKLIARLKTPKK
ncbi:unnamed protein product [Owenia fusiformis]|uniref:GTPase Era, mitochondrial n=1 Tax=Owenia fusiformis TaxID=6347 RepID=A0A8J1XNQ3_OWEFU|nr:unnamed protein product [Owenia fusiformis]